MIVYGIITPNKFHTERSEQAPPAPHIKMKEIISSTKAPAAIGPYSQAVSLGNLIFASGQIPLDPATGNLIDGAIEEQTTQVLSNIKGLLESVGSSMDKVLKTTVFLTDLNDFVAMNAIYAKYFTEGNCPARSTVQVSKLPKGANVEIEVIAEK